ncbi:hypothetical protein IFR05_011255 [Cadophora sp. M221]|nr:hypothetical protein IFR05_011255 [Cadophora sp. M221]
MVTMERFQREGIRLYDQAARDLKSRGMQPSFYMPNFHVVISDGPSNVDCVLLVLPADSANGDLAEELRGAASQSNQIIVLINKMDKVGWSEETFQTIVKSIGPAVENVPVIPFCALKGDNAVEVSSDSLWYKGTTLLDALETAFRT